MKIKTTQKQIKNNYKNVISVGYCNLWYLLRGQNARFFTSGVYGWNADIYEINSNTVIVTGYRPFGNIESNQFEINKKYNEKAKEIYNNSKFGEYEKTMSKINKLLEKYINEILKGE